MHSKTYSSIETGKVVYILFSGPSWEPGNIIQATVNSLAVESTHPDVVAAMAQEMGYHQVFYIGS